MAQLALFLLHVQYITDFGKVLLGKNLGILQQVREVLISTSESVKSQGILFFHLPLGLIRILYGWQGNIVWKNIFDLTFYLWLYRWRIHHAWSVKISLWSVKSQSWFYPDGLQPTFFCSKLFLPSFVNVHKQNATTEKNSQDNWKVWIIGVWP